MYTHFDRWRVEEQNGKNSNIEKSLNLQILISKRKIENIQETCWVEYHSKKYVGIFFYLIIFCIRKREKLFLMKIFDCLQGRKKIDHEFQFNRSLSKFYYNFVQSSDKKRIKKKQIENGFNDNGGSCCGWTSTGWIHARRWTGNCGFLAAI